MPKIQTYRLSPGQPTPGTPNLLRPSIALTRGAGILTCFPSTTTFVLALGPTHPAPINVAQGNLGLSACGFFTRIIVTHVSIRTSDTSSRLLNPPSTAYGTLLYRVHINMHTPSFGSLLSPVKSSPQTDSTSELLRFL